jgi:hypothetical protein
VKGAILEDVQLFSEYGISGELEFLKIDHHFVSNAIHSKLVRCFVGEQALIFAESVSDHLPSSTAGYSGYTGKASPNFLLLICM